MTEPEAVKALAEKATPGPWEADNGDGYSIWTVYSGGKIIAQVVGDSAETDATAAWIAAANPQTVLKLIARIERLELALKLLSNNPCMDGCQCQAFAIKALAESE